MSAYNTITPTPLSCHIKYMAINSGYQHASIFPLNEYVDQEGNEITIAKDIPRVTYKPYWWDSIQPTTLQILKAGDKLLINKFVTIQNILL